MAEVKCQANGCSRPSFFEAVAKELFKRLSSTCAYASRVGNKKEPWKSSHRFFVRLGLLVNRKNADPLFRVGLTALKSR